MKLIERVTSGKIWRSVFRTGRPDNDVDRSRVMTDTLLLHIHPVKVSREALRFRNTLGLGVISAVLFLVLTITGVLLMFYYVPSKAAAYRSMRDIENVVTFGRLLRRMHRWAAHGMVIAVFLHMCRVFHTAAYKAPRELNWVVGVALLLLTLFLSFTGYLLPWDQLAFWAITVGTSIARYAPVVGESTRQLLLGGREVGDAALLRFYVLHCFVLPGLAFALIALHLWRVRKDGGLSFRHAARLEADDAPAAAPDASQKTYGLMALVRGESPQVDRDPDTEVFSWPHLLRREVVLTLFVLVVLLAASLLFEAPLEHEADPAHPTNPAKSPWYFLWLQELVSYDAFVGGVLVPGILVALLMALPYLDTRPEGVGVWFHRSRRMANIVFALLALAVGALIVVGEFFRGPNWAWTWPW